MRSRGSAEERWHCGGGALRTEGVEGVDAEEARAGVEGDQGEDCVREAGGAPGEDQVNPLWISKETCFISSEGGLIGFVNTST